MNPKKLRHLKPKVGLLVAGHAGYGDQFSSSSTFKERKKAVRPARRQKHRRPLVGLRPAGRHGVRAVGVRAVDAPDPIGAEGGHDSEDRLGLIRLSGELLGDPEGWFMTPNPRFGGRQPIELVGTKDEFLVCNLLRTADQGLF